VKKEALSLKQLGFATKKVPVKELSKGEYLKALGEHEKYFPAKIRKGNFTLIGAIPSKSDMKYIESVPSGPVLSRREIAAEKSQLKSLLPLFEKKRQVVYRKGKDPGSLPAKLYEEFDPGTKIGNKSREILSQISLLHEGAELKAMKQRRLAPFFSRSRQHFSPEVILTEHNVLSTLKGKPHTALPRKVMRTLRDITFETGPFENVLWRQGFEYGSSPRVSRHAKKRIAELIEKREQVFRRNWEAKRGVGIRKQQGI